MRRVLCDGDACPVKEEIAALQQQYHFEWWIFIDVSHVLDIPTAHLVYCDVQRDSADQALWKEAKRGDIVVTGDLGLAGLALTKGVCVLDYTGRELKNEMMDQLLFERFVHQKVRQHRHVKGPKKRSREADRSFFQALESILEKG